MWRGNLAATEKVDIKENGSVEGDIVAPRVAIADGAHFRGSIDMQRKEESTSTERSAGSRKRDMTVPMAPMALPNELAHA